MLHKRTTINLHLHLYAPTETSSNKNSEERNNYYQELEDIIRSVPLSNMLIICGDMNAKTGSGHQLYPCVIGKYGKCQANNNGQQLIEICSRNELNITNTFSTISWLTEQHGSIRSAYKIIKTKMETSEGTLTEIK